MLLSVHDRLILLAVISLGAPQTGNMLTMRIVHDLSMAMSFTEEEMKEKQLVIHDDGRATWQDGAPTEIEIGQVARGIIQKGLKAALPQWDEAEALTVVHISLFDRFNVDTTLPEPQPVEADGILEPEA